MSGNGGGPRVGPYRLTQPLGAGVTGQVYLGERADGGFASVKVVHPARAADPAFRAWLAHALESARKVRGAGLADVLDADPAGARPWVAARYVPGPTLERAVAGPGPLPAAALAAVARRTTGALAELHATGEVHGDVKPAHVVLSGDGAWLIDCCLGRTELGGAEYMSPEQVNGGRTGPASDVFALAGTLVFAATGRPPFGRASSPTGTLVRVAQHDPDLAGVPDDLRAHLAACLAKDPKARPTAAELAARLNATAPPAPTPPALTLPVSAPPVSAPPATTPPVPKPPVPKPPGPATSGPLPPSSPVPPAFGGGSPSGPAAPRPVAPWLVPPPPKPKKPKRHLVLGALALVVLLGVVAAAVLFWPSGGPEPGPGYAGAPVDGGPAANQPVRLSGPEQYPLTWRDVDLISLPRGNGPLLVSSGNRLRLLDVKSGAQLYEFTFAGPVTLHEHAVDGPLAYVVIGNAEVVRVNLDTKQFETVYRAPDPMQGVWQVVLADEGRRLLMVTRTSELRVLDLPTKDVRALPLPEKQANTLCAAGKQAFLTLWAVQPVLLKIDLDQMRSTNIDTPLDPTDVQVPRLREPVMSPDGKALYALADRAVIVLDTAGNTVLRRISRDGAPLASMDMSPSGRYLYVLNTEGLLAVLDAATGQQVATAQVGPNPAMVRVTEEGRKVLIMGRNGLDAFPTGTFN